MYFVGKEFSPDNGGYKTLAQAKKQAEKKEMKVFDTDGAIVWPEEATEAAETTDKAETVKCSTEAENAEKGAKNETTEANKAAVTVELTDDVPEGALEDNADGSTNIYNEAGEKVGTLDKASVEKVMKDAATAVIIGTIEVIYKGMIAVRNAPKWGEGHKCGIVKTGYKADVVEKAMVDGKPLYMMKDGKWISGQPKHVKFTVAK